MHECYGLQIPENKKNKNQRTMFTKRIAMKHKDHVRKRIAIESFASKTF